MKIHSIVDVITNSSTEIFSLPHKGTVNIIKDMINEILKEVGSDKTADDLFDIKILVPDYDSDDPYENYIEATDDNFYENSETSECEISIKTKNGEKSKLSSLILDIFENRELMT